MKLRFEEHSLRLRLAPDEVAVFARVGRLTTTVALTPPLTYTLERDPTAAALQVRHEAGGLRVLVPAALADAWTASTDVALRGQQPAELNQTLHILVEKDLGCRH